MIPRSNNIAVKSFIEGKAKKTPNTVSTGEGLYLFGNKIAEWRPDGLYISNGGYVVYTRNGNEVVASATTKTRLNDLPGVRVSQAKGIVTVNGVELKNNDWIKIENTVAPDFNPQQAGDVFDTSEKYIRTDGWRGYSEPKFAVVGANDTGTSSDSPCPSDVREAELKAIAAELHKEKIETKQIVTNTSNVFCVHVYLIVKVKFAEKAREIVEAFLENNETRLSYLVKG